MLGVANAPVSFGVFELTAEGPLPEPELILEAVRETGYDAIDLGPVGWLGDSDGIGRRLRAHGLSLAGGWLELPFTDDDAFAAALPEFDGTLRIFAAAAELDPDRPPLPTLADAGSDLRRAHPGGAPGIGLDDDGWQRMGANVTEAARRVWAAGLEPTFHHHACTHVETPEEIETFLEYADIGLTLDTGHLLLGGGEPLTGLARWRDRVNHVHLKDARRDVLDAVVRERGGMREVWERRAFVPLGSGDLDVEAFMALLAESRFDGWLVVEQDVLPGPGEPLQTAIDDQRANREALRPWLP